MVRNLIQINDVNNTAVKLYKLKLRHCVNTAVKIVQIDIGIVIANNNPSLVFKVSL